MEWNTSDDEDEQSMDEEEDLSSQENARAFLFDTETRDIQAMLFKLLWEEKLTFEVMEKNMKYLDLPIKYFSCKQHWISADKTGESEESSISKGEPPEVAYIRAGECPCDDSVKKMYDICLVHLVSKMADFDNLSRAGCDLDGKQAHTTTISPLLKSIYLGNLELFKYLLSKNVDVNMSSRPGNERPLWYSIVQDMSDFVELLLAHSDIDVNIKSSRGYPLLHFCLRNQIEYFDMLVNAGAETNITDTHLSSPLMVAVSLRSVEAVNTLVRHGADVNHRNRRNEVPLIVGVYGGNRDIIEILLEAGADPNFVATSEAETPLLLSCFDGDLEILELLIKYKADVRKANTLGYTPLHIAAWNGHSKCVQAMLKAGALHDVQTSDLNTPLALAAHGRHLSVVKDLLPLGCNVNSKDKDEDTTIHYAAYNGMTRTMELLIEYGADPNCGNRVKATPLWNAVYCGYKETVKFLLKQNVEMERASEGIDQHHHSDNVRFIYEVPRSPLWVAVNRGFSDIALLLVTAGYNIYTEQWLLTSDFPGNPDNDLLHNMLSQNCHTPPKLITACRTFVRKCLGLRIAEKVEHLEIPTSLKSYLTLSEMKYVIDELKENDRELDINQY